MKKYSFMALFFLFSSVLILPVQSQAAPKSTKEILQSLPKNSCGGEGSITDFKVGGFKNYPPFSWATLDEELYKKLNIKKYNYQGFVYEKLKTILNDLEVKRIQNNIYNSYYDLQKAMLRGQADLNFTSYYVDEAKSGQDYIFPAYFGNPFIVISRKTKQVNVNDITGLSGLSGVVRKEEEVEALIQGLLPTDTKIEVVDGAETAFRMLLSGDVDFMITSPYAAEAESKRFKVKDKLYFCSTVLRHIKYFVAFSKMSKCRPYKKEFEKRFTPLFADKAKTQEMMKEQIAKWVALHADDPPLEYTPATDVLQQ